MRLNDICQQIDDGLDGMGWKVCMEKEGASAQEEQRQRHGAEVHSEVQ